MLYLIESGCYLKIGYAKDIEHRMKAYNTHNPDYILLDSKEGTTKDESSLHWLCRPWRVKNEWFENRDEVIETFKKYTPQDWKSICNSE